jgi:hypothetical protein
VPGLRILAAPALPAPTSRLEKLSHEPRIRAGTDT